MRAAGPNRPTGAWQVVMAMVLWLGAVTWGGGALDGFSHLHHPVSLPGASGAPHALAFNVLAFVVPGTMLTVLAWRLRTRLPPGTTWVERMAMGLLLVSAVALAMQGLLPLDLDDINDRGGRWHASAWLAWWLAFAAAQLTLALGGRGLSGAGRVLSLGLALAVPLLALWAPQWLPAGLAQRGVYVLWFGWWWWWAVSAGLPVRATRS